MSDADTDPARDLSAPARLAAAPGHWLRTFGAFWWDFLVGDTPELLVGGGVVVAVAAVLVHVAGSRTAALVALPSLVTLVLVTSLHRAARKGHRG